MLLELEKHDSEYDPPEKFDYVSSKAKGQISKRVFQENKVRRIFQKNEHSYPLIHTRTCVRFSENLMSFIFLKHPF